LIQNIWDIIFIIFWILFFPTQIFIPDYTINGWIKNFMLLIVLGYLRNDFRNFFSGEFGKFNRVLLLYCIICITSVLVNADTVNEVVTKGRSELCRQMTAKAQDEVRGWGIELLDIVPRQVKYSDELNESVYNSMIKDRNQVAQAYRSLGEGKKAEWLGRLENDKRTIASEAYRKSEEIKGAADAEAAAIYAAAYNKDIEFYTFWKSMESYKQNLKDYPATYSTKMDYFNYLYGADGKRN
jgi:hypothetical protein